jgi:alanyl-tRNA synthetase
MESNKIRQNFLDFFKKRGHKIVPSSSLLPADPSVLFTTAGMQQFKEYFLGKDSPYGKKVTSCQKCFRTSDIEKVGDTSHLTFLEMLGNFSFGDYFKKEAIKFAYDFIKKELGLEIDFVSVFAGDKEVLPDKESEKIWLNLGIPQSKIKKMGREDNFWGPTGLEGPCGPTSEIYLKGFEVWNLVFNEYYQDKDGKLTPLKQKGVDTGMGLERLAAVVQKKESVFETDLFKPIIKELEKKANKAYNSDLKSYRIIADHIKSAVFLISEGIFPSNVERGYALRRILRRAIRYRKILDLPQNFLILLAQRVIEIYENIYPELKSKQTDILVVIQNEEEKFGKTLEVGITNTVSIVIDPGFNGEKAYNWYATSGVPFDIIKEIAEEEKRIKLGKSFELDFEKARKKHQEISRAGVEKKFGGVGKDASLIQARLHTATHLLHRALREVLGPHVKQMGSDITPQRLRFDFSHPQKMTSEEIKKVEDLVNQKIKEDLEVKKEEMGYEEAIKSGALAFFKEKYPGKVNVFSIGDFSREICAGPHVNHANELGHFKIVKEESSGAGVRRIRATLE